MYISTLVKQALSKLRRSYNLKRILPTANLALVDWTKYMEEASAEIVQSYLTARENYNKRHAMQTATVAFNNDQPLDMETQEALGMNKLEPVEIKIDDCNFSVRTWNCIKRANIDTLNQLAVMDLEDIMRIRNAGRRTYQEIGMVLLQKLGITRKDLLEY